jgi:hypothetical protein
MCVCSSVVECVHVCVHYLSHFTPAYFTILHQSLHFITQGLKGDAADEFRKHITKSLARHIPEASPAHQVDDVVPKTRPFYA